MIENSKKNCSMAWIGWKSSLGKLYALVFLSSKNSEYAFKLNSRIFQLMNKKSPNPQERLKTMERLFLGLFLI